MAPHVKSKRQTLRHKYKVVRKVREHHRKVRRANKHKPEVRKIKSKDPGIPNLWPFKQQMMEDIERKKLADAEARKAAHAARRQALANMGGASSALAQVVADAQLRDAQFEAQHDAEEEPVLLKGPADRPAQDGSRRAFMKEFNKVVEGSDVILQVLDARDPMGCRCYEAERSIMASAGAAKRIVLVLNKVDLVPKDVVDKWLSFLRNDFPTIAFRASVQEGRSRQHANMTALAATSVNTPDCLGAANLLSLLKNYCRSRELKTSISVGVIGYPNVGKSSLINSLKRSRAVNAGATPGVTRTAQEVHLDKNIRLIDCPGIVFSTNQADALVLRNCIKIENLHDVFSPVEVILKRVGPKPLMVAYGVPAFDTMAEFLACICSARGKMRTGGAFDLEAAARIVLQDWNCGNIPFYTLPPKGPKSAQIAASVVQQWGEEFDVKTVSEMEKKDLDVLRISSEARVRFAEVEAVSNADAQMEDGEETKVSKGDTSDREPTFHVAIESEKSS